MTQTLDIVPRSTPESRLRDLGLTLPDRPPEPIGNFRNVLRVGRVLHVSGQGPVTAEGALMTGKVGRTVSTAEARDHARLVGLNILAAAKAEIGDLSRIKQVVRIFGMVNAAEDFTDHPAVIDGCSDLLCAALGAHGIHARSAVGLGSLPNDITVEIEAIIEIW